MRKTHSITEAAVETRLTTIERVKAELSILGDENNGLLGAKIDEATSDIEAHLGRVLNRAVLTERFWEDATRWISVPALILERTPVVEIESVEVDDEVLDSTEYRFDPDIGLLYRLHSAGSSCNWQFCRSVVVVYEAGYLLPGEQGRTLPFVLESACIELVQSFWLQRGRDPTVRQEDIPGLGSVTYWVGAIGEVGELPPGVMSKITPFRRMIFA